MHIFTYLHIKRTCATKTSTTDNVSIFMNHAYKYDAHYKLAKNDISNTTPYLLLPLTSITVGYTFSHRYIPLSTKHRHIILNFPIIRPLRLRSIHDVHDAYSKLAMVNPFPPPPAKQRPLQESFQYYARLFGMR
jgi:hypothetical protein